MNNSLKLINEAEILNQWKPVLQNESGITDDYKLNWLAKYSHFHQLSESADPTATFSNTTGMGSVLAPANPNGPSTFYTGSVGSGDKFPSLLPLAIQVASRTIGFDIVNVVPMGAPTGILTYLDYNYADGRLDGVGEDLPHIIKINAPAESTYTVGTKYWGVQLVAGSETGGTYTQADTDTAIALTFVGFSRIDGYPIFRFDNSITSGANTGATRAGGSWVANNTQTLASVFPGGANSGAIIVNDSSNAPGTTTVSAHDAEIPGVAELVKTMEDHIQGFSGAGTNNTDNWTGNSVNSSNPATPMGRNTGETTYFNRLGLQVQTKFVQAETFQVVMLVTTEQIQDLRSQYGLDVMSMIENALVNEVSQSINKHILHRAFALGWSNHVQASTAINLNANLQLDPSVNTVTNTPAFSTKEETLQAMAIAPFQTYGGAGGSFENQDTILRRIQSKVLYASNVIANRGRRGQANFAVTNLQLGSAIQNSSNYSFAPLNNTINQNNGSLYPIGNLAGVTVYVDPNMDTNDNRVLVGRRGSDEEPGLVFMPYLMAESIQTIAESTMSPKVAVKSRYALVEAGHHPETMYLTFYVNVASDHSLI